MSERIKQQKEDINTTSIAEDMFYFGNKVRDIYKIVKNQLNNLISKK